jgi:hypothetical protein
MTAIPRRDAIEVSRDLNLAVGIPATVRRSRFPPRPRPNVSRPVQRASAKSRFSTTTAVQLWSTARSSNAVMAARTRPSRRVAGKPAMSTAMVTGAPTGLPEESRTHAAR